MHALSRRVVEHLQEDRRKTDEGGTQPCYKMHALTRQLAEHVQDEGAVTEHGEKAALKRHARAVTPAGGARAGGTRKDRQEAERQR